MGERVTISYRGAAYELGRGKRSYGIWAVGEPRSAPVERWPETQEGWNAAWSRFTGIETPGTIVAARSSSGIAISASVGAVTALLAIGVLCGLVGLFPGYLSGSSLASQPPQLVPHVFYLGAWTLSAVLILLGGVRQRAGALLGLGTSIVTFGLFFADLGQVIAFGGHVASAGLWFSLVGWLACAAGSVLACLIKPSQEAGSGATVGAPGIPRGYEVACAVLLILAGIGVAIAFAPSWDSYLLRTASGQLNQTVTAGNAFSNPGAVIAGDLMVMIAFGLVVVVAALWRPLRLGAMLLAGAVIPMAAQAISALVQVGEATPPEQFGISSAQASQNGLTISNGVTADFWIYCILLVVLAVSFAWMLITPPAAATTAPAAAPESPPVPPETVPAWPAVAGETAERAVQDEDDWADYDETDETPGDTTPDAWRAQGPLSPPPGTP